MSALQANLVSNFTSSPCRLAASYSRTSTTFESSEMSFAKRLAEARMNVGLNQTELAKRLGVSAQSVQQWESGNTAPRSKRMQSLAWTLGVSQEWLAFGVEPNNNEGSLNDPKPYAPEPRQQDLSYAPRMEGYVPVLDWVQAGQWAEIGQSRTMDLTDAEQCPRPPRCGPNTFALKVRGESMIERYEPGTLIFIDPDVEPVSGDDVVVQCESHGTAEATFKRYIVEPGTGPILKVLNKNWKQQYFELTSDCRILGVVMAQMWLRSH